MTPDVDGPHDVPALRDWLLHRTRTGGTLRPMDGRFIHETMKAATLWWVEEETCHLLAESAPTWPADKPLDLTDLPAVAGLAVLAHDIEGQDAAADDTVRVSAIAWGPVLLPPIEGHPAGRTALGIGMFSRLDLHRGLNAADLRRGAPVFQLIMEELFPPGAKPGDRVTYTSGEPGEETVIEPDAPSAEVIYRTDDLAIVGHEAPPLTSGEQIERATVRNAGTVYAYLGRTDWEHDRGCESPVEGAARTGLIAERSMAEDRRLLATLWAITRTPVVSTVRTRPPRVVARRSERKGQTADVRVLRLGGPHRDNIITSEPAGRDWQHSWIVRPHWRWQAHGPGRAERKLILVGPYTKGPSDKPLLGAERVWRVVPPTPRGD